MNHYFWEKYKIRFLQASDYMFANQSIYNMVLCVLLFKGILFNMYIVEIYICERERERKRERESVCVCV